MHSIAVLKCSARWALRKPARESETMKIYWNGFLKSLIQPFLQVIHSYFGAVCEDTL